MKHTVIFHSGGDRGESGDRPRAGHCQLGFVRPQEQITERFSTEFRAEFFNFANHANWLLTGGARDFGNSSFGVVQNTQDPRIIQFGLKLKF